MPEVWVRHFAVSELFDVFRGSAKYIKAYYREHPGPYPVYSASIDPSQVHGMVDGYDFDGRYLTWTTNGYAGFTFVREGRFSATRDVGLLRPKAELANRIDLGFFAPVLTKVLREAATGRRRESGESDYLKIASGNASIVKVPVPVDDDGWPSLPFQEAVAARYASISALKIRLAGLLADLSKKRIAFAAHQGATLEFKIADLFDVGKGNSSFTRSYILAHAGEYPVYTGSSFRNETAGHIDTYVYDGNYLTWAADGYAGPVFARSGRFSANSHSGILKPKAEFAARLHLPYLEYALTPIFESMAVGRYRPDGSPDYTRVTAAMVRGASVILPVDADGRPDEGAQEAIAERIAPLERDKLAVEAELRRLIKADILVDWIKDLKDWREDTTEAA